MKQPLLCALSPAQRHLGRVLWQYALPDSSQNAARGTRRHSSKLYQVACSWRQIGDCFEIALCRKKWAVRAANNNRPKRTPGGCGGAMPRQRVHIMLPGSPPTQGLKSKPPMHYALTQNDEGCNGVSPHACPTRSRPASCMQQRQEKTPMPTFSLPLSLIPTNTLPLLDPAAISISQRRAAGHRVEPSRRSPIDVALGCLKLEPAVLPSLSLPPRKKSVSV